MANLPEEARWEEGVHQWEVTDPVMGGPDGIDNKPIRQLANRTKYLKEHLETGQSEIDKELKKRILTTAISSAIDSTSTDTVASSAAVKTAYDKAVQASNVAGGKIATTAISSSVTSTSNSTVASSSAVKQAYDRASQAINAANTKVSQSHISNAVNSTSTTTVASSAAVKTAYDKAVQASNVAGGKIATTAISSSVTSTSNSTVASSGAVKQAYDRANQAINAANTKVAKSHISNAVNSTSTTTVASSAAVKTAYDKAAQASNAAGGKVSKAGDTMTGSLMFSGRNQSAVGNYNYLLTDQIWSVGEQFTNDPEGKTFGNLYGLAYKYDATNMARGHQMVWCENGQPQSAIGKNVWTRGYVNARSGFLHNGQHLDNRYAQASAMIGVPIPYPSATPPAGYLAMKGQVISQSTYPKLYALYGSHLPDMRGEFIRGWDNGRGVDSGRGIKTRQGDAIRNIVANSTWAFYHQNSAFGGALRASNTVNYKYQFAYHNEGEFKNVTFDASRVVPTANENRPRNIAFNYICLAG